MVSINILKPEITLGKQDEEEQGVRDAWRLRLSWKTAVQGHTIQP